MIKKFLFLLLALFAAAAFAAADANKATQAELEAIKGIGPALATKILDERKKGAFKDWQDMVDRVKGVGENNAVKFSEAGLTVGGSSFKGAAPKPEAAAMKKEPAKMTPAPVVEPKKDEKAMAKTEMKKDDKPVAAKAEMADPKAAKKAEREAKKAEKAKAAEEKKAAKAKAADDKASAPKASEKK